MFNLSQNGCETPGIVEPVVTLKPNAHLFDGMRCDIIATTGRGPSVAVHDYIMGSEYVAVARIRRALAEVPRPRPCCACRTETARLSTATRPWWGCKAATAGEGIEDAVMHCLGGESLLLTEFRSLEAALPETVVHRQKDPTDRNATAVVDRAIHGASGRAAGGATTVAEAYNARPHQAVTVAPEDVETMPAVSGYTRTTMS